MIAVQVSTLPKFLTGLGIQAGGAVGSKVHINTTLLYDRGGSGVRVQVVVFGLGIGHIEDFDVVFNFSRLQIDADGEHFGTIFLCRCDPSLILPDDRGGPSEIMNRSSPLHVFCA